MRFTSRNEVLYAAAVFMAALLPGPLSAQSLGGFLVTLDVDGEEASAVIGPGVEFDPAPADARFSLDVMESGAFRLFNISNSNVVLSRSYRLKLPAPVLVTGATVASTNVAGIDDENVSWTEDSVTLDTSGALWEIGAETLVDFSFQLGPPSWSGDTVRARSLGDLFDQDTAEIGTGIEFDPAPGFAPLAIDAGSDFVEFISLTDGFQWTFNNRRYDVTNIADDIGTGVIVDLSVDVQNVSQLPPESASFTDRSIMLDLGQSRWADDSRLRLDLALSIGNLLGEEVTVRGINEFDSTEQMVTVDDLVEFPSLVLAPELELDVGTSWLRIRNTSSTETTTGLLHYEVDGLDWLGLQIERVYVNSRAAGPVDSSRIAIHEGCVGIDLSDLSFAPGGEIYLGLLVSAQRLFADRFTTCSP